MPSLKRKVDNDTISGHLHTYTQVLTQSSHSNNNKRKKFIEKAAGPKLGLRAMLPLHSSQKISNVQDNESDRASIEGQKRVTVYKQK